MDYSDDWLSKRMHPNWTTKSNLVLNNILSGTPICAEILSLENTNYWHCKLQCLSDILKLPYNPLRLNGK